MRNLVLLVSLAACGSSNGGSDRPAVDGSTPTDSTGSHGSDGSNGSNGSNTDHLTVFTIILENHDYKEIVGSANAPYINSLIAQGALATNYKDTNHPSLPNYLHMISGADQYPGVIDVNPTQSSYFPANQPNLGTQLEAANIPWRSYQESMGTPCKLTASGPYAPKHDPFLYFVDQQSGANNLCANTNVDYTNFAADLAAGTYRYMWITPNLTDDGHDPSTNPTMALTTSDNWLKTEVPKILASDAYQHGGILFITWDESEGRNGDDPDLIPMIVLANNLPHPGKTDNTAYTHSSYLATVEDLFSLPRLATVTSTPSLMPLMQ
ncbi:MAG: alkaline phosphatase family protein [Kofleriaceae bacterium]